jgi:hypothetical protein
MAVELAQQLRTLAPNRMRENDAEAAVLLNVYMTLSGQNWRILQIQTNI